MRDIGFITGAKLAVHGSTGAQLANLSTANNIDINGVRWSSVDNEVSAVGTATSYSTTMAYIFYNVPIIPGDYYISGRGEGIKTVVRIENDNDAFNYVVANHKFTLTGDEKLVTIYLQVDPQTTVNERIKVMLNKGDTPLPYEPYTGGTPYTDKYKPTITGQTGNSVTLSIENVSATEGDTTVLDIELTDKNGVTKRSEDGKPFIGGGEP